MIRVVVPSGRQSKSLAARYSPSMLFSVNVTLALPPPTWLFDAVKAAQVSKSACSATASSYALPSLSSAASSTNTARP